MKPNPQPEWLRNITYGMERGWTYRLLIDGVRFAVVQMPGHRYVSGQYYKYGQTSYVLVDKHDDPRGGHGIMNGKTLKDGGRIGSQTKARWKALVDRLDGAPHLFAEIDEPQA